MKLRYRPGGLRPPDPLRGGGLIAFKWPDRSPTEKNPGDATACRATSMRNMSFIWCYACNRTYFQFLTFQFTAYISLYFIHVVCANNADFAVIRDSQHNHHPNENSCQAKQATSSLINSIIANPDQSTVKVCSKQLALLPPALSEHLPAPDSKARSLR